MGRPAYEPKPGTVAYRALGYMQTQPEGAELTTGALAVALGVPTGSIVPCLLPLVDAGMLFRRQKGGHVRSPTFWSLQDHGAAAQEFQWADSQHVVKAEAGPRARPDATDREEKQSPQPARASAPMGAGQPADAGPAGSTALAGSNATISMSGDIAIVADCGTVILFTGRRAHELREFFAGRLAS